MVYSRTNAAHFVLCRARVTRPVVEDLELTREKACYRVLSVL
jgi:hypothetical protein